MGIDTDEVAPQASVSEEQRYNNYINSRMGDAGFLAELAKRTPEEQEIFKRQLYRSYEDESALATDEMMMAEELRNKDMPGMRQSGAVSVAANPLEFLAKGIGDYQAKGMRNDARDDLKEQAASKEAGRTEVANLTQNAAETVAQANAAQTQQQALAQAMQNSENDKIAAALRSGQRYTR
jgi:hypothetical protein